MPTPQFPTFGSDQFEASKKSGCASDACDVNFIINKPSTPIYTDNGDCGCDCPPGPQGPPGPRGANGASGDGACGNFYGGPLVPENTGLIDERSFAELLDYRGYIVALSTINNTYDQDEIDADITTYYNGNIGYISFVTGLPFGATLPPFSDEQDFYPLAYETIGENGVSYYNHTPSFRQFLEMCGKRDSAVTGGNSQYYMTGNNRNQIPSLLNPRVAISPNLPRIYTFISNDSSVTSGASGPYKLSAFKSMVAGVVGDSIFGSAPDPAALGAVKADNPTPITNLGHQIAKEDGTIGVAYDCDDCIQTHESNHIPDAGSLTNCDKFIDTENGVLYNRDPTGDWDNGNPKFNENGIPLRRQPKIPEIPQGKQRKEEFILATIISSIGIATTAPFHRWKYTFQKTTFVDGLFVTQGTTYAEFAYNGAEAKDDIEGIGEGLFDGFTGSTEMLPIRNGTVVHMKKQGVAYVFSMPNAYKVRCE